MKIKKSLLITGFVLFLIEIMFNSCYDYGGGSEEFTIQVDSITLPQSVVHSYDSLKVAFWGDVTKSHWNGHLKRFDISQKTDTSVISAIGYWCQGSRGLPADCATGEQILTGYICPVYPVTSGIYTIVVNQPDGGRIVKQVQIQ